MPAQDLNEKWTGRADSSLLPQAVNDTFSGVSEDARGDDAYVIPIATLLANDKGGTAKPFYSADTVSFKGADITISPDGTSIIYNTLNKFDYLASGQTATDTFTYTIRQANGALSTANVTLNIVGSTDHDTVNFDDIVPVPTVIQNGYHGFNWFSQDSSGNDISNFYLGYEPPGIELGGIDSQFVQNGLESKTSTIERSDGSEFDIASLDVGQINNNGTNYQATSVTFQGLRDGAEIFSKTVSLDGMPWDGTVSADYQHVQLDFYDIDQLNIISTGSAPSGAGQWAIDNMDFYI